MEQITFSSDAEASKRWKEEGLHYKNSLNDWLDIIYMDGENPTTPCPEETRKDMDEYIVDKIGEYNENEKFDELRELFPPDVEPIDLQEIGVCLSKVLLLKDNRIVVTVNEWYQNRIVYILDGNTRDYLDTGIFMTGKSHDKKFIAKVYPKKIDIHEGWDGAIVSTFNPPASYGEDFLKANPAFIDNLSEKDFGSMHIHDVVVFPKGDKVAIASAAGIFILSKDGFQVIATEAYDYEEVGEYEMNVEYPHIDISPDEKYLVAGSKDSEHLIFENENKVWTLVSTIEPFSSYPNYAKFNYNIEKSEKDKSGPQLLLSSCHFSRSSTVSLPVDKIKKGLNISTSDDNLGDSLYLLDNQKWLFATKVYSWGWALGTNDGYLWFKHFTGDQVGYLHIGLTTMDIDFSSDGKKMIVASYGQVIVYELQELFNAGGIFRDPETKEEKRKDAYAITNTAYIDTKRYMFFNIFNGPAVW